MKLQVKSTSFSTDNGQKSRFSFSYHISNNENFIPKYLDNALKALLKLHKHRGHLNTTVVTIFPNVCLWRHSLCSDLVLNLKNCIEPPSYARTAYVVAIWPSFLFDSFVKIWATCKIFLGKWFTAPPPRQKISRTPMLQTMQWRVRL